eukprot:gene14722-biopygen2780
MSSPHLHSIIFLAIRWNLRSAIPVLRLSPRQSVSRPLQRCPDICAERTGNPLEPPGRPAPRRKIARAYRPTGPAEEIHSRLSWPGCGTFGGSNGLLEPDPRALACRIDQAQLHPEYIVCTLHRVPRERPLPDSSLRLRVQVTPVHRETWRAACRWNPETIFRARRQSCWGPLLGCG